MFPRRPAGEPIRIEPCPVERREAALDRLHGELGGRARRRMVVDVLDQAAMGEFDLSGLWHATRGDRPVGALLTQALAGRAAGFWAPQVARSRGVDRRSLAAALVATALDDYRRRGFRLAQALLPEDAPPASALDLARGGLPPVTQLVYLARPTDPPLWVVAGTRGLDWRRFDFVDEGEFGRVLARTYAGSLDMPELEGARSLDDVVAGHRSGAPFDAGRWWLGRLGDEAVAVVLLAAGPEGDDAWELSYLGLVPEARGRGLGRVALAHALEVTRPHAERLKLAADARNTSARRLYEACGFRAFDRRMVHLAVLGRA